MIKQLKLVFLFLALALNTYAVDYYVAKTGDNTLNDGKSLATPFLTIQKAASLVKPGDNVYVRGGVYRETVRPAEGGTNGAPITFQPYNGENVTISGAEEITGWTAHTSNIYKAPLAANFLTSNRNQSFQIFVNEQMMTLAQWPNRLSSNPTNANLYKAVTRNFISKNTASNVTTGVMDVSNNLPPSSCVGAEIYFQPDNRAWSWLFTGKVTAVSGGNITFQSFSSAGKDIIGQGRYDVNSRYFVFNKLSLLDREEEWFHDAAAGVLYLQAPGNQNPSTLKVEAKKREYAFNLTERSFINIKGFNLFACTITTDIDAGGVSGEANRGYDVNGNVIHPWRIKGFLAQSSNVIIDGIKAKYLTHYTDVSGHMFLQWGGSSGIVLSGSNHEIKNSTLQFSAGNGITLNGQSNKATNNTILDMDYMANDCAAISTVGSQAITQDHEISYNTIIRTGRSGIQSRSAQNSNPNNLIARIHHNDISNFMLQDWDGGGIYGTSESGTCNFLRVDHNIIHDAEGFLVSGIYYDFARSLIIDHNLIYNVETALKNQGTSLESGFLTNNALMYNNTTVVRTLESFGFGPFNLAGGATTNIGTVSQNNILIYRNGNSTAPTSGYRDISDGYTAATKVTNFVHSQGDPKFIDFTARDFQLQASSPCINAGTLVGSIVRDGITVPPFNDAVTGVVDQGAFEFGQPAWKAGATAVPITPVELVNFTGKETNIGNNLTWTTLNESNNKHFEILKSTDGVNFLKIGTQLSNVKDGTSSQQLNYSFLDKNKSESSYYRLNQIDFDGKSSLSNIIYVPVTFANNFENAVYPNPVSDVLNAAILSTDNNNLTFTLFDAAGKMVYQKVEKVAKGKSTIGVNMENKKTGWYVLNVKDASGKIILTKKVIKQ